MASQWPTLDLASFLYSHIFYQFLQDFKDVRIAYAKTIWSMRNGTKDYFASFIMAIKDENIRQKKLESISGAPEKPFENIFLYSGMLLYGLI